MSLPRPLLYLAALAGLLALPACRSTEPPPAAPAPVPAPLPAPVVKPAVPTGPSLAPDGTCTGPVPTLATAIEPGISECELVRLKAKPPTDVLVGEGRAGREVQVLYAEPGARELYFFVNGRLDRIVK